MPPGNWQIYAMGTLIDPEIGSKFTYCGLPAFISWSERKLFRGVPLRIVPSNGYQTCETRYLGS